MNDAPNFQSILDESPTEVIRPKPLPVGTYICVVGTPKYDKSTKKKTDYVEFPLKPVQAGEDVDDNDLAECIGDQSLSEKEIRHTFYLTPEAVYRLDEFHEHCGLDLNDGTSRKSRNEAVINRDILVVIKHVPSDDGKSVYANVARTLPVE